MRPFKNEFLTKNVLELIFKRGDVFKESRRVQDKSLPEYLYQYGKKSNYFIIILTGEATIEVGREKLEFVAGQFAYFGVNALLNGCESVEQVLQEKDNVKVHYMPDFSLRVDDKCVYFKIDRDLWLNGVKKSKFEIENNEMSTNIDLVNTLGELNTMSTSNSASTTAYNTANFNSNTSTTINSINNNNSNNDVASISTSSTYQTTPIHKNESNYNTNNNDLKFVDLKNYNTSLFSENFEQPKSSNGSLSNVGLSNSKLSKNDNLNDKKDSSECVELMKYKEESD